MILLNPKPRISLCVTSQGEFFTLNLIKQKRLLETKSYARNVSMSHLNFWRKLPLDHVNLQRFAQESLYFSWSHFKPKA
jgi:hypothetical protein